MSMANAVDDVAAAIAIVGVVWALAFGYFVYMKYGDDAN